MNSIPTKKKLFGAIYGGVAGIVFSIFTWGYHAYVMAEHFLAAPWFSFLMGGSLVIIITTLVGYLSLRSNSTFISSLLWSVAGIVCGSMAIIIPLMIYPNYINTLNPELAGWLQFKWSETYLLFLGFSIMYSIISFLIIGLLEHSLIESAYYSLSHGPFLMALIICSIFGGAIGGVVDSFANSNIRKSVVALDEIIVYTIEHRDEQISKETRRILRLAALNPIKNQLSDDRKLYIFSVNETFDQSMILLKANSTYALCYVFQDQPSNCTIRQPGD